MQRLYMDLLERRPIATKAGSAFVLGFCSNLIASSAEGGPLNVPRAINYALMNCPPYSHFWYPFLDSLTSSTVIKVLIDQLFWRPALVSLVFSRLRFRPASLFGW